MFRALLLVYSVLPGIFISCREEPYAEKVKPAQAVTEKDIPAWADRLEIVHDDALVYTEGDFFMQKTFRSLPGLEQYYTEKLTGRHGFELYEKLDTGNGMLLFYEKGLQTSLRETVSIELRRLPDGRKVLIRSGYSSVQYEN